ncbi:MULTISPECIES: PaaI family thioesterase [Limibacillus]|uniref:Medium/long-chain acyl-CoA thioesterase YigI n=1 Tax=Limibacillus halophilus TaxID=1579333 RepID=A0A839SSV5_9PROT|nr:PaaI family thioesterase [Limibacillus halophilus]MBB3064416.1 uncharacterized protein (TIGR00369 family) [Limibacillus halophilus]
MKTHKPIDPDFRQRVTNSFRQQTVMSLIGAELTRVDAGLAEISLPYRSDLCQQNGYFHAGITSTIADSAGGYAAYTLFPPGSGVLTVEFKINLLAPAFGDKLVAIGYVVKPGRTLTVCDVEIHAVQKEEVTLCAKMQQTLIRLDRRKEPRPS